MPKETKQIELQVYEGKLKTCILASGRTLTIREKNGDDDDILSDMTDQHEGRKILYDNFNRFIASIVVRDDDNNKPYITTEEVAELKVGDKYQLLLLSRIHSDGPELHFGYICENEKCQNHIKKVKVEYLQDLNDYLKPEEEGFPYFIPKHPNGKKAVHDLLLSSGKKIRYKYLTGQGEYKGLELIESGTRMGKNLDLMIRDLEVWNGTDWQIVGTFSIFNSTEMREIRTSVAKEDPQWPMLTDVQCPQCKHETSIPLIMLGDFFYPSETSNI